MLDEVMEDTNMLQRAFQRRVHVGRVLKFTMTSLFTQGGSVKVGIAGEQDCVRRGVCLL